MLNTFMTREKYHATAIDALRRAWNAPDDDDAEKADDAGQDDADDVDEDDVDAPPTQNDLFKLFVGEHHQYDGTGTPGKPSGNAFTYNDWDQMREVALLWFYARRRKQHRDESEADSRTRATAARDKWVTDRYPSSIEYAQDMMWKSLPIIEKVVNNIPVLVGAPDGITVVEFDQLQNMDTVIDEIGGVAANIKGHTRTKCAYMAFSPTALVMAHEVGHHLMCSHAPGGKKPPEDTIPNMHDKDDDQCLMSYHEQAVTFCGKCLLRLRGWDASALDPDGTKNSR
jgi:hypothetical protein